MLPMSVSFTSTRICTRDKSAILSSVVPPLAELPVADAITMPSDTGRSIIVPESGATTRASSKRCFARSRLVLARTMPACACVSCKVADSYSLLVIIRVLNSSSERFLLASATSSCALADRTSASDWSTAFCVSRVSICASRSPARTCDPVSTGILIICPPAFDFTSTTLMGSTAPVAVASTVMLRRSILTVPICWTVSFFF